MVKIKERSCLRKGRIDNTLQGSDCDRLRRWRQLAGQRPSVL